MILLLQSIFGVEREHFSRCGENEKRYFKIVLVGFLLINLFALISFIYFFVILTNSYVGGILLSILLTFIFYSVLRFTLLTFRLGIGEVYSWKRLLFNPSNLLRIIICLLLFTVMSIPFTTMVNHHGVVSLLDIEKRELLNNYSQNRSNIVGEEIKRFDDQLNQYKLEIESVRKTESDNGIMVFKIDKINARMEAVSMNKEKAKKDLLLKVQEQIKSYDFKLKEAGMPFKRFQLLFSINGSKEMVGIFNLLLLLEIFMYMRLMFGKKYEYGKYALATEKKIIETEYHNTLESIKTCFRTKFKNALKDTKNESDYPEFELAILSKYENELSFESLYEDPPFNKIKKFKGYTELEIRSVYDHYKSSV